MFYDQFKHKIPVQLRFNDIDKVGHVNNACYHTFIELGRVHYLDQVLQRDVNWEKRGFVLARTEMDHKKPIFIRDEVFCFTRVSKLGNKSITILSSIAKKVKDELVECAAATGILVAMDYEADRSIEIPATWREKFSYYEKL